MTLLKRFSLPLILIFGSMWFCNSSNKKKLVVPAFYYWRQAGESDYYDFYNTNKLDTAAISRIKPQRLYVKFFDIDWREGNGAYPRQRFHPRDFPKNIAIVPTFYILNRVFEKSDSMDLENLAERLEKFTNRTFPEIQLDCDWTNTTRDNYFFFIRKLRQRLNPSIALSVTIRLHQIKFRDKTGIPPADRGMLMVYNFQNPSDFNEHNSIFETEEAHKYLDGQKDYPLPLDVALPLFRWGIGYRANKFNVMLNGFNSKEADSLKFLKKNGRFYDVIVDTVFEGKYLRFGDKIKIEEINDEALLACANVAAPFVRATDTVHIAYFHYDTALISSLKPITYEQVYKTFAH
jgi:hypothetical protein